MNKAIIGYLIIMAIDIIIGTIAGQKNRQLVWIPTVLSAILVFVLFYKDLVALVKEQYLIQNDGIAYLGVAAIIVLVSLCLHVFAEAFSGNEGDGT